MMISQASQVIPCGCCNGIGSMGVRMDFFDFVLCDRKVIEKRCQRVQASLMVMRSDIARLTGAQARLKRTLGKIDLRSGMLASAIGASGGTKRQRAAFSYYDSQSKTLREELDALTPLLGTLCKQEQDMTLLANLLQRTKQAIDSFPAPTQAGAYRRKMRLLLSQAKEGRAEHASRDLVLQLRLLQEEIACGARQAAANVDLLVPGVPALRIKLTAAAHVMARRVTRGILTASIRKLPNNAGRGMIAPYLNASMQNLLPVADLHDAKSGVFLQRQEGHKG